MRPAPAIHPEFCTYSDKPSGQLRMLHKSPAFRCACRGRGCLCRMGDNEALLDARAGCSCWSLPHGDDGLARPAPSRDRHLPRLGSDVPDSRTPVQHRVFRERHECHACRVNSIAHRVGIGRNSVRRPVPRRHLFARFRDPFQGRIPVGNSFRRSRAVAPARPRSDRRMRASGI